MRQQAARRIDISSVLPALSNRAWHSFETSFLLHIIPLAPTLVLILSPCIAPLTQRSNRSRKYMYTPVAGSPSLAGQASAGLQLCVVSHAPAASATSSLQRQACSSTASAAAAAGSVEYARRVMTRPALYFTYAERAQALRCLDPEAHARQTIRDCGIAPGAVRCGEKICLQFRHMCIVWELLSGKMAIVLHSTVLFTLSGGHETTFGFRSATLGGRLEDQATRLEATQTLGTETCSSLPVAYLLYEVISQIPQARLARVDRSFSWVDR
ncbi:hypothetical protein DFH27DRAFT_527810 [Peziza echinospora]|nr:hypothetical protein DFH27DRAFT_527810 [Peziza echinospora]